MTWSEDKAIRGRNPSAEPGAKTEGSSAVDNACRLSFPSLFGSGVTFINTWRPHI